MKMQRTSWSSRCWPPRVKRAALAMTAACGLIACRSGASGGGGANGGGVGEGAKGWQEQYDLTGDGVKDRLEVSYSGGGHCCYTVAMIDGSSGGRIALPFELDGGYPRGLDLSQPERFAIVEGREGRPARLELEIETYNGEPERLPADGFGLGVTSHRVAVTFAAGKPRIENLGWRCARALTVIQRGAWEAWEGLAADCDPREVFAALDAVPLEITSGSLGAAKRPVTVHRAERAEDGAIVIAYTARDEAAPSAPSATGARPLPRVLRLDLVQPELAAKAAATLTEVPASQLETIGAWRYWRRGLAVRAVPDSGTANTLTLVPSGDAARFLRELN